MLFPDDGDDSDLKIWLEEYPKNKMRYFRKETWQKTFDTIETTEAHPQKIIRYFSQHKAI